MHAEHQVPGIPRPIHATKLDAPYPRIYYVDVTSEMRVTMKHYKTDGGHRYEFFANGIRIAWNECEGEFAKHEIAKRAGHTMMCCKDPYHGDAWCKPEVWAERVENHRQARREQALRTIAAWEHQDPERAAEARAVVMDPAYY